MCQFSLIELVKIRMSLRYTEITLSVIKYWNNSLEGGWTIGETKVHYEQLKEALVCAEHSIPLVTLSDMVIVVSVRAILLT
jgi:hypothetical protein